MNTLGYILIVDDEPFQRKGLTGIICARRPGIRVDTARNGRLALHLMQKNVPDLVITDIRMPVMDGLELAKAIRQQFPSVHVALVSAYQEFDYAKQAIRYGVVDYLIKPYMPEDIERLLSQVEQSMKAGSFAQGIPEAKEVLTSLLSGRSLAQEERERLLRLPGWNLQENGCLASCMLALSPPEGRHHVDIREALRHIAVWLKQQIGVAPIVPSHYDSESFFLLLSGFSDTAVGSLVSDLQTFLHSGWEVDSHFGISKPCSNLIDEAGSAAKQADESLQYRFYQPVGSITLYREIAEALSNPMPPLNDWEASLSSAVSQGNLDDIHEIFQKIESLFMHKPYHHPGVVKHYLSNSVFSIVRRFENRFYAADFGKFQNDTYVGFFRIGSLHGMIDYCEKILGAISMRMVSSGPLNHDRLMEQFLKWIQNHLESEISLAEAAGHFHFNSAYFSSLIKQKTGMSYGQYVLSLRMRKARTLLCETSEKVQNVALRVGYRDPGYFNRIFKRENGITPDQYRRRNTG